ncbi:hypothetical protein G4228_014047 [Cervus hanglu yarkandensis]|nr:hypothetical protein G4228_014047 [Cervus hanglu yarkandensis]
MWGTRLALPVLVLAACCELVVTLQCYTCPEPISVSSCITIATCNANETMCKTTLYSLETGEALSCITCEQPTALPLCKNITYCKPDEIACKTTLVTVEAEFPFNESPVVTSTCARSCEATDPDSIGAAHPIFCCFHDLCNSVGAARLSAGALAPLGAVVLSHLLP